MPERTLQLGVSEGPRGGEIVLHSPGGFNILMRVQDTEAGEDVTTEAEGGDRKERRTRILGTEEGTQHLDFSSGKRSLEI